LTSFREDFNKIDIKAEKESVTFVITKIPGFAKLESSEFLIKERGDVDSNELYNEISLIDLTNINTTKGFDFFLSRMKILPDEGYDKYVQRAALNINLLYDKKSDSIVLIRSLYDNISTELIFEGIIHQAQLSYLQAIAGKDDKQDTIDSILARRAILQGQLSVARFLADVQQHPQDKTVSEVIDSILSEEVPPFLFHGEDGGDIFDYLSLLPGYYGFKYILKTYYSGSEGGGFYEILNKMPSSTKQVLHPGSPTKETKEQGYKYLIQTHLSQKILFETACGEYFIKFIFDMHLPQKNAVIRNVTSGWIGDHLSVIESSKGPYFIWETVWDNDETANDFVDLYNELINKRATEVLDKQEDVFIKREKRRVFIVEGNVSPLEIKSILNSTKKKTL
jgi:hypothetical protein